MLSVMIKPVSCRCNMACAYCFYREEAKNRSVADFGTMSDMVLEVTVKKFLETGDPEICFLFQGGEPALAGINFYEKAVRFQKKYKKPGQKIYNSIQTNGLMPDGRLMDILSHNGFLVGLSLDGPPQIHDLFRRTCGGQPTCREVLHTLRALKERRIPHSVLAVVTKASAGRAREIYRYFQSLGIESQQYIPCMEPERDNEKSDGTERGSSGVGAASSPYSLSAAEYGGFLRDLFDVWFEDLLRGREVYIRYFDNLIRMARGEPPESCDLYGRCSVQYVVESNANVYPCDFYCTDRYLLGNLCASSLADLDAVRNRSGFLKNTPALPPECGTCRFFSLCRGGCKRDRQISRGAFKKSRYCRAYQEFFPYVRDRLTVLAGAE